MSSSKVTTPLMKLKTDFSNFAEYREEVKLLASLFDKPGMVVKEDRDPPDMKDLFNRPIRTVEVEVEFYNTKTKETTVVSEKWSNKHDTNHLKALSDYDRKVENYNKDNAQLFVMIMQSLGKETITRLEQANDNPMKEINGNSDGVRLWILLKTECEKVGASNCVQKKLEWGALRQTGTIRDFIKKFEELMKEINSYNPKEQALSNHDIMETLKVCLDHTKLHGMFYPRIWEPNQGDPNYPVYETIRNQLIDQEDKVLKTKSLRGETIGGAAASTNHSTSTGSSSSLHLDDNSTSLKSVTSSELESVKAYLVENNELKKKAAGLENTVKQLKSSKSTNMSKVSYAEKVKNGTGDREGNKGGKRPASEGFLRCWNCGSPDHLKNKCTQPEQKCSECSGEHCTPMHYAVSEKRSKGSNSGAQKTAKVKSFMVRDGSRSKALTTALGYEVSYDVKDVQKHWPIYANYDGWDKLGVWRTDKVYDVPSEYKLARHVSEWYDYVKSFQGKNQYRVFLDKHGVIGHIPLPRFWREMQLCGIDTKKMRGYLFDGWRNCWPDEAHVFHMPSDIDLVMNYNRFHQAGGGWAIPSIMTTSPINKLNIEEIYQLTTNDEVNEVDEKTPIGSAFVSKNRPLIVYSRQPFNIVSWNGPDNTGEVFQVTRDVVKHPLLNVPVTCVYKRMLEKNRVASYGRLVTTDPKFKILTPSELVYVYNGTEGVLHEMSFAVYKDMVMDKLHNEGAEYLGLKVVSKVANPAPTTIHSLSQMSGHKHGIEDGQIPEGAMRSKILTDMANPPSPVDLTHKEMNQDLMEKVLGFIQQQEGSEAKGLALKLDGILQKNNANKIKDQTSSPKKVKIADPPDNRVMTPPVNPQLQQYYREYYEAPDQQQWNQKESVVSCSSDYKPQQVMSSSSSDQRQQMGQSAFASRYEKRLFLQQTQNVQFSKHSIDNTGGSRGNTSQQSGLSTSHKEDDDTVSTQSEDEEEMTDPLKAMSIRMTEMFEKMESMEQMQQFMKKQAEELQYFRDLHSGALLQSKALPAPRPPTSQESPSTIKPIQQEKKADATAVSTRIITPIPIDSDNYVLKFNVKDTRHTTLPAPTRVTPPEEDEDDGKYTVAMSKSAVEKKKKRAKQDLAKQQNQQKPPNKANVLMVKTVVNPQRVPNSEEEVTIDSASSVSIETSASNLGSRMTPNCNDDLYIEGIGGDRVSITHTGVAPATGRTWVAPDAAAPLLSIKEMANTGHQFKFTVGTDDTPSVCIITNENGETFIATLNDSGHYALPRSQVVAMNNSSNNRTRAFVTRVNTAGVTPNVVDTNHRAASVLQSQTNPTAVEQCPAGLPVLDWEEKRKLIRGAKKVINAKTLTAEQFAGAKQVWHLHRYLGHPSDEVLINALMNSILIGTKCVPADVVNCRIIFGACPACEAGKAYKNSFKHLSMNRPPTTVGGCVHVDIYILHDKSIGGYMYYLIAIDEISTCIFFHPLKSKSADHLCDQFYWLEAQFRRYNRNIIKIQADSEASIGACNTYLGMRGIVLAQVPPYQHAQRIERYVRTIKDKMRTTLAALGYELPTKFYGELAAYVIWQLNSLPNKTTVSTTPFKMFRNEETDLNMRILIPFGSVAMANQAGRTDLGSYEPRSSLGIVLGPHTLTYGAVRFYLFETETVVIRDNLELVTGFPTGFPFKIRPIRFDVKAMNDVIFTRLRGILNTDLSNVEMASQYRRFENNDLIVGTANEVTGNENDYSNELFGVPSAGTENSEGTESSPREGDIGNATKENVPTVNVGLTTMDRVGRNVRDEPSVAGTDNNGQGIAQHQEQVLQMGNDTSVQTHDRTESSDAIPRKRVRTSKDHGVQPVTATVDNKSNAASTNQKVISKKSSRNKSRRKLRRALAKTKYLSTDSTTPTSSRKNKDVQTNKEAVSRVTKDRTRSSNERIEEGHGLTTTDSNHQSNSPSVNQRYELRRRQIRSFMVNSPSRNISNVAKTYQLSIKQCLQGDYRQQTIEACREEVSNMLHYKVGHYVKYSEIPYQERKNIIHSFMFMKHKTKPDGSYDKTKARLVGNGAHQGEHMYDFVSSSTVALSSVFLLLNIASYHKAELASYDVKGAFLNAEFGPNDVTTYLKINKEVTEIWVQVDPTAKEFVERDELTLELDKFIYGLKQSPYKFQQNLKKFLLERVSYTQCRNDDCVYHKQNVELSTWSIISTHVDDLLQVTNSTSLVTELHEALIDEYKSITFHPNADAYVGISIKRSPDGSLIQLTQKGLTDSIIETYCKKKVTGLCTTPCSDAIFEEQTGEASTLVDKREYLSLVMSLMYLARLTRPDILMPVTYLATKSHCASQKDMDHARKICKYLQRTPDLGVTIECTDMQLHAQCDASHILHNNSAGHTGYIIGFGKNLSFLLAKSGKQKLRSDSSTEAEIHAAIDCVKTSVWIRNLLSELGVFIHKSIVLHQDNEAAEGVLNKNKTSKRLRHLNSKMGFIQDHVDLGIVETVHTNTEDMVADMLTKPLHGERFYDHRMKLMNLEEE